MVGVYDFQLFCEDKYLSRGYLDFRDKSMWCAVVIACLMFVGCRPHHLPPMEEEAKLPTRSDGTSDRVAKKLYRDLNARGVHVITMGQNYLISIPAQMLFSDQSPKIRWESYALLNDVVCYLQEYKKISVHVSAFSSQYVSARREHALTLARAKAVAEYLWSQGIDARFIFSQGIGREKPVIAFAKRGDVSQNSRIEITFRRAAA